jgi:hypothetical protein
VKHIWGELAKPVCGKSKCCLGNQPTIAFRDEIVIVGFPSSGNDTRSEGSPE